ncbi:MAG TPA: glycosyltransferase family 39 protein, partial [Pirellulales bacterium]|nr:glycosyltransferase family 39 protein [Pirellulales bacterium]
MQSPTRQQLLLIIAATLIFFVNLGGAQLWDDDEPKNAQCAREMLGRGDWVVPTFNGELRPDKPVLVYWLMMSAYQAFGDNEFAARFGSAVAAIGTTLATYHLGRTLFNARVAFWSGWIVASSLMFVVAGRAATPDSLMILCTTLAMLAFVRATWGTSTTLAGANRLSDYVPRSWSGMAATYACMALGVLAKGPVALVLPTLVLLVYLVVVRQRLTVSHAGGKETSSCLNDLRMLRFFSPAAWFVAGWKLRPLTALLMLALIALPWYLAVGFKTDGDWLAGFFGHHNVSRFLSPMEGHHGPFFYYVLAIAFGFFPWTIFLPQALMRAGRKLRGDPAWAAYLFVVCWAGVWTVFFSFSGTKLPSYVTPAYPALALIAATWIDAWLAEPDKVNRWVLRQSLATLILVGIAAMVLLPILALYVLPGEAVLGVVGLVLAAGGSAALGWAVRRPDRAAMCLAATSLTFMLSLFGFAAVRASQHQNSAALIRSLRASSPNPQFAAFDFAVPGLVYYSQSRVPQYKQADDAVRYLQSSPQALVITYTRGYEELRPLLPADVTVVARERRFLRRSEVIVLGHAGAAAYRTAARAV